MHKPMKVRNSDQSTIKSNKTNSNKDQKIFNNNLQLKPKNVIKTVFMPNEEVN